MKTTITRSKGQVYSVGNYLMTGKVLGKGHFARVEEATHRIIGKKVAIKVIDLTCIKEEYARRNLHREPRVMAKLRHPCIAALYETMMHGPRLYVVMEAAGGGDLCTHVLAARGTARGLPESRARGLAAQLVSAVRHMHARGVVHRDLKMENIMLDTSKQFIKIVDFGLSNVWSLGGALRTPCGSLEYAAPELFVDGRRYGPEVDLWSVGVIVYGMVTGGLPFAGEGGEGRSRPQLRAAISRGFTRKQRAALTCVSAECKNFIQHLLEPNVELRMKIEEASRHRWIKKPGLRMKTHPFGTMDPKVNREIYRQISELSTQTVMDVVAQIKADPFGSIAGMYNVKCHLHQLQLLSGADLLWSSNAPEPRPVSPPEYKAHHEIDRLEPPTTKPVVTPKVLNGIVPRKPFEVSKMEEAKSQIVNGHKPNPGKVNTATQVSKDAPKIPLIHMKVQSEAKKSQSPSPRCMGNRPISMYGMKQPVYKIYDNGDCGLDPRLPSIDEHSNTNLNDSKKVLKNRTVRAPCVHKISLEDERPLRLNSCPNRLQGDAKKTDFYRRAGDALPSWRASGAVAVHSPATRILLQTNSTTIKRASLGSIVSPHSSSNSHCKSERAMPVGWFPRPAGKEAPVPRLRRTLPLK